MTTIDTMSSKSLRLPVFDGEAKKYMVWWARFTAYAGVFGFLEALEHDENMPSNSRSEIDISNEAGKKQLAAKKRN
jgi:hypothetical protein